MKKLLLFCLPLLFCSCKDKVQANEKYGFPQSYDLVSKTYDTEIITFYPRLRLIDNTFAVLGSDRMPGGLIKIFSIHDGFREMCSYGHKGRGPGEFMYAELTSVEGDQVFVRNVNKGEVAWLKVAGDGSKVTETRRESFKYTDEGRAKFPGKFTILEPMRPVRLGSGYFAGVSYIENHNFFSLWDDSLNFVRYFGDAPIPEEVDFISSMKYLQGLMESHGDSFVYASLDLPYLAMYEMISGEPVKKWDKYYLEPVYKVQDGNILLDKESFGNPMGLKLGKDHIYLVFLDIPSSEYDARSLELSLGNIVFVFDYDGNPVARLNLDHRVTDIAISPDERTMYAIASKPEYYFAEYTLPDFK